MVFAAAGEPSSRTHSPSRAARMTCGSLRWLTGSELRSSQASALAVAGSGARERRGGLNAYPYRAARSIRAGGLRLFHRRIRHRVLIPGEGRRRWCGPCQRLAGGGVEIQPPPGGADQFCAVAVGQCPGDEGPGLIAPGYPPADLEHPAARPAPDREHADIDELTEPS